MTLVHNMCDNVNIDLDRRARFLEQFRIVNTMAYLD